MSASEGDTEEAQQEQQYYLQLSEAPIRFDGVSQLTNVFFDDTNGQVFAVRSSGVTGVIVKGPDQSSSTTFRMEDKGAVISIKFSPDLSILAIQRSHTLVDFMNFEQLLPTSSEYSQSSKWKNGTILGFVWTKPNEIVFISDHGIEILQIFPEKKQLKSIKSTSITASWFQWCAKSKIVLLASENGASLHPYLVNNSVITKLPRVEMEGSRLVNERDVNCVQLYKSTWCLVLKHGGECPAEVLVIPLEAAGHSQKTHILRTGLVGRFAINLVDDLVVVHHQDSKSSILFDIMEDGTNEGSIVVHTPVAPPKSLKQVTLADQPCQMYSSNWVVFQPDIVIDARLGCLWRVILKPNGLLCGPPGRIVGVLLRRAEGRTPIFTILQDLITEGGKNLAPLMEIFDQINAVYRKWAEVELAKQMGQSSQFGDFNNCSNVESSSGNLPQAIILSQQDIYTNVLQHHTDSQYIVQVVVTLLCSLARHKISPQHALTEMLVRALVKADRFSDLHQLLQYGAIGDSKPLACLLLSLANLHPAAHQLALDMLHRLNAQEEVVEVLLGGGEVITAIGVAKQYSMQYPQVFSQMQSTSTSNVWNSLPARKLLSAAQGDVNTFISVYHALENRNRLTRNSHCFFKGEQCDSFVQMYHSLFPDFIDR